LWFCLLFDILDDEQLTKELRNKLKGILEIETNPQELIVANLPKEIQVEYREGSSNSEGNLD
jgi:hypothetical protein